jgi:hypothetical protein
MCQPDRGLMSHLPESSIQRVSGDHIDGQAAIDHDYYGQDQQRKRLGVGFGAEVAVNHIRQQLAEGLGMSKICDY